MSCTPPSPFAVTRWNVKPGRVDRKIASLFFSLSVSMSRGSGQF